MSTAAQALGDELVAVPRSITRVVAFLHDDLETALFHKLCWASFAPEPGPMPWIALTDADIDALCEDVLSTISSEQIPEARAALTGLETLGVLESRTQAGQFEYRLAIDAWSTLGGRRKR